MFNKPGFSTGSFSTRPSTLHFNSDFTQYRYCGSAAISKTRVVTSNENNIRKRYLIPSYIRRACPWFLSQLWEEKPKNKAHLLCINGSLASAQRQSGTLSLT